MFLRGGLVPWKASHFPFQPGFCLIHSRLLMSVCQFGRMPCLGEAAVNDEV